MSSDRCCVVLRRHSALRVFIHCALATVLLTCALKAQEMEVSMELQFALLEKILTFERTFMAELSKEVSVGIVFQGGFRRSVIAKEDLSSLIEVHKTINTRPARLLLFDLEKEDIQTALTNQKPDVLYICPLRGIDIEKIKTASRMMRTISFTGVADYVWQGIAIGFSVRAGKPSIIINRRAAQAEGANFDSRLLRIARVIE